MRGFWRALRFLAGIVLASLGFMVLLLAEAAVEKALVDRRWIP